MQAALALLRGSPSLSVNNTAALDECSRPPACFLSHQSAAGSLSLPPRGPTASPRRPSTDSRRRLTAEPTGLESCHRLGSCGHDGAPWKALCGSQTVCHPREKVSLPLHCSEARIVSSSPISTRRSRPWPRSPALSLMRTVGKAASPGAKQPELEAQGEDGRQGTGGAGVGSHLRRAWSWATEPPPGHQLEPRGR